MSKNNKTIVKTITYRTSDCELKIAKPMLMPETKYLSSFDPVKYLDNKEAFEAYIEEAFKTGDASFIARSLGVVARAKGMADIAKETGVSREQLYRSLGKNGNPTLKTVIAVSNALGLNLTAKVT